MGAVLSAAAQIGRMIPSLEPKVDAFVGFASSPLPWFVLFSGLAAWAWFRSRPEPA